MMFDYNSKKWRKKSKHILRIDGYKDIVLGWYGCRVPANIVHHIYPVEKYPEYAYCDWNLISVSIAGHNKLENRKTGELTALGKSLMKRTIPGVDWRKKTNPPCLK